MTKQDHAKKSVSKRLNGFRRLLLVLLIAVVGAGVLLLTQAADNIASLSLTPASGNHDINSTLTVGVYEDSGTTQVNAVDIGLVYDTSKLQFQSASTANSSFTPVVAPAASSGRVIITSYINPGSIPSGYVTGRQLIATVSFKVLAGTGSTNITFLKEAPSATSKSAVYQHKTTTNIWDGVTTGGSYTLTTPDTTPPVFSGGLSLSQSAGRVVGSLTMTANVSDSGGMSKVEFYVDGALKSTDNNSPYSYTWNSTTVGDGVHSLYAKAYDVAGNVSTSATTTITVKNTPDPGDANNDGQVNAIDLLAVLNNWLATGRTRSTGDLTGDGTVNIQDLLQILNNWSV